MHRRRNPPEFGGQPPVSKTPSPPPSGHSNTANLERNSTYSAPLSHRGTISPVASLDTPTFCDYELDQLAKLPEQYLRLWYLRHNDVFSDMMCDFMKEPEAFLDFAAPLLKTNPDKIVRKYAKAYGLTVTFKDIIIILESLTTECDVNTDSGERLLHLAEKIKNGLSLDVMLDNGIHGPSTLLRKFTSSFRQLTEQKREYVSKKMVSIVKKIPIENIADLTGLLAYSATPNIPEEQGIPRLPMEAMEAIVDRLNHQPKNHHSLSLVITKYIDMKKSVHSDPVACRKILENFCREYASITSTEKRHVIDHLKKILKNLRTTDIEYLHGILEFSANNTINNADHPLPHELLLQISFITHDYNLAMRLAADLEKLMQTYRENNDDVSVKQGLASFNKHYTSLSRHVKRFLIPEIYQIINRQYFDEFQKSINIIGQVQKIVGSITLDELIEIRIAFQIKVKIEDNTETSTKHIAETTIRTQSITQASIFKDKKNKKTSEEHSEYKRRL